MLASYERSLTPYGRHCPRWCLPDAYTPETCPTHIPYIIPDVVFHIPIRGEGVLPSFELQFDPPSPYLDSAWLPLLMVEYVKTSTEVADGLQKHLLHLKMEMVAAARLYKALKMPMKIPIFGLLVERYKAHFFAAWSVTPPLGLQYEVDLRYRTVASLNLSKPHHCLWLRLIISDIVHHGKHVREIASQQLKALRAEKDDAELQVAAASREPVNPESLNTEEFDGIDVWRKGVEIDHTVEVC